MPRGTWKRGLARLEGDFVVVDGPFEEWEPVIRGDRVGIGDPIVELATVRDPADVVDRATRFGLLRSRPEAANGRERVRDWIFEARVLETALGLYRDVQAAKADPTPELLSHLREAWEPSIRADGKPRSESDAAFLVQAARMLADLVSTRLVGVQERVSVAADEERVDRFVFDAEAPDLLSLIYHQFAILMTRHAPLRACADPRCGRFFTPSDARQMFCSKQHATRTRVRKLRTRQEGDAR
jgi:hypothetical protein